MTAKRQTAALASQARNLGFRCAADLCVYSLQTGCGQAQCQSVRTASRPIADRVDQ